MHRKQKTPPKRGSKLVGERGFEPPTHWSILLRGITTTAAQAPGLNGAPDRIRT